MRFTLIKKKWKELGIVLGKLNNDMIFSVPLPQNVHLSIYVIYNIAIK